MKTLNVVLIVLVLILSSLALPLHAQLVADGATATINTTSTNVTGNLTIGTNGSFTSLVITNGGAVTNSSSGIIGLNVTSKTNRVVVTGTNSIWDIGTTLVVGSAGSANLLLVTNGGLVANNFGNLANTTSSSNNTVIITGTNSLWTMSNALNVGNSGASNQLVIANGGRVENANAQLGNVISSSRNRATVTGPGSIWVNALALDVGRDSSLNQLTITNGGRVVSSGGYLAGSPSAFSSGSSNSAIVTGVNSAWTNTAALLLGYSGSFNQLTVSNAGVVINSSASVTNILGNQAPSLNNAIRVTGTNSFFLSRAQWRIGSRGSLNQLSVQNGGRVESGPCFLGESFDSSNNLAVVAGPGSVWSNTSSVYVGYSGFRNQLFVTNGSTLTATNLFIGFNASSSNNLVTVTAGNVFVTNAAGTGTLDVRRGTNVLNSGNITANRLLVTNPAGFFEFNRGTLSVGNSSVNNGQPFIACQGGITSAVKLLGHGLHTFNDGLIISNAYLQGSGTITGLVTISSGGSIDLRTANATDKLSFSNTPSLNGYIYLELNKDSGVRTNDEIHVASNLVYGGRLVVVQWAGDELSLGDRFRLFRADNYSGEFTGIYPPLLSAGLKWSNHLLVDGSIEVVADSPPVFTGMAQDGTNLFFGVTKGNPSWGYELRAATNVALPWSNWLSLDFGLFDWMGNATITNGINPAFPTRFFRLIQYPD